MGRICLPAPPPFPLKSLSSSLSGIFFVFLIYLFISMNVFRKKKLYLFQKWKTSIPSHEPSQETQGRDVTGVPLTCLSVVPNPEAGFLITSLGRGILRAKNMPSLAEKQLATLMCLYF